MNYLAIGPNCWGKGTTREVAVKNAKLNWPSSYRSLVKRPQDKHFSIYTSEGDITVDDFGRAYSTDTLIKIQTSILAKE